MTLPPMARYNLPPGSSANKTELDQTWEEITKVVGSRSVSEVKLYALSVRALPGRLSGLRVLRCKSVLYGMFVLAHRVLNCPFGRFLARAVLQERGACEAEHDERQGRGQGWG